nr:hypothetical protein [Tanacetum cinerariifolium]
KSINYEPVTVGNQTNDAAGIEINVNAGLSRQKKAYDHEYILLPFMPSHSPLSLSIQSLDDKDVDKAPGKGDKVLVKEVELITKKEYPTKNPSSAFHSNLPRWSKVFKIVKGHPKGLMKSRFGDLPIKSLQGFLL